MGYRQAGFYVTGVDIEDHSRGYPGEFVQGDALEFLKEHGHDFDVIHASPPCQGYSEMKDMPDAKQHPLLIGPTRDALIVSGKPYVIENVEGAKSSMTDPITLCGSMFGLGAAGFQLRRHRLFESNVALTCPPCAHTSPVIGVYGGHVRCRSSKYWRHGGADFPGQDKGSLARQAMGIEWMTMADLSEAIPPAYTEHIGRQLTEVLRVRA